jgi:hypothetical protein
VIILGLSFLLVDVGDPPTLFLTSIFPLIGIVDAMIIETVVHHYSLAVCRTFYAMHAFQHVTIICECGCHALGCSSNGSARLQEWKSALDIRVRITGKTPLSQTYPRSIWEIPANRVTMVPTWMIDTLAMRL